MKTQENKIDVLVEIGGIYGSGMNVSSYPDITIAVLNYNTMDYQARCKAEEQASEIRKGFKDASDLEIIRLAFPDPPAPIDWAKESDRIAQMREKAIAYILESVADKGGIVIDGYAPADGDFERSFGCQMDVKAIVFESEASGAVIADYYPETGDSEMGQRISELETSVLIDIASQVQKAIASK